MVQNSKGTISQAQWFPRQLCSSASQCPSGDEAASPVTGSERLCCPQFFFFLVLDLYFFWMFLMCPP